MLVMMILLGTLVMRVLKVAVYFVVHISVHLVARDSM